MTVGDPAEWPEAQQLGRVLSEVFGCRPPEFRGGMNNPGLRCIVERFAEGSSEADLADAIRGAAEDPHIADNRQFQTLQTILRDASQVEKFKALAGSADAGQPRTKALTDEEAAALLDAQNEAAMGPKRPEPAA